MREGSVYLLKARDDFLSQDWHALCMLRATFNPEGVGQGLMARPLTNQAEVFSPVHLLRLGRKALRAVAYV